MTGKGSKDTRKDAKKYNESVYWKIRELKELARYVEGEIVEHDFNECIKVLNDLTLKANRVKAKQLMSFIDFKADYYEVVAITAKKGEIIIELWEK